MLRMFVVACGLAACAYAQVEIGVVGGYGFSPKLTVKGPSGSADTGFRNGAVFGAFAGEDSYRYWSGEVRYLYRYSNLRLSAGSADVNFAAHTHLVTIDFLRHLRPREDRIRPFFVFGGGAKVIKGTGIESAAQPLGRLAALTATSEVMPVADGGFGVKVNVRKSVRVRFEVRDYVSRTPNKVIAPAPGASFDGVLNDIVGSVAISFVR